MTDALYKEHILDHYRHPRNVGRLDAPSFVGRETNPWCGDEVLFSVKFDAHGAVEAASFEGTGCAVSLAAASLLTEFVKNKKMDAVGAINHIDIMNLLGVVVSPGRVDCATLALKALQKGLLSY